jgi:proliferating cell nuclear antigen
MGVIGVNVNRMVDVLGVGNSGDTVHLKLDSETRKLVVTVDGLEYTLALIDPASIRQEPDIPEIPLESEVNMKGSVLGRAVKSANMVSEHIGFRYGGYDASFYADGDTDDVDFDLTDIDGVEEINNDGEGESLFSLDYLKDFDRMVPKNETITAEFGEEMPLKFFFNVADSHAQVETLLAPRIKTD